VFRNHNFKTNLKNIIISNNELSPTFDPNITEYVANVASDVLNITIIGETNHANAKMRGNVNNMALEMGENKVNITVTAENGVTEKTYTVTVFRAASIDATLNNITVINGELLPTFAPNITEYEVYVASDVANITIIGEAMG